MAKSRASKKRFEQFKAMAAKRPRKRRKPRRMTITRTSREVREVKGNPPLLADLAEYAIPGLGGFVITKFMANLASSQIAKRWPRYAKHAGAVASIGSFLSAWWLGHRVSLLARWHSPIVVGSAIASAHNLMQLYFPDKLAWVVGSPKHAAIASAVAAQQAQAQLNAAQAAAAADTGLPDHLEEVYDDPSWYTFNDAYDAGRYRQQQAAVAPAAAPIEAQPSAEEMEDEDLASGLFANNGMTASMEN